MESREDVWRSIREVRKSRVGLTTEEIGKYGALLAVLGTDNPEEGVARLSAAVERLMNTEEERDLLDARSLRAALGIGMQPLKNVTARREGARKQGLFYGSDRAQFDAEDRAINRLTDLLIEEAAQRTRVAGDLYQEGGTRELARSNGAVDHDDAPEPVDPGDQAPAGRRAKMRAFYYQYLTTATPGSVKPMSRTEKVVFSGIAVTIVTLSVLMLIGIVPTSLHHHSSSTSTQPGTALVSPKESNETTWSWGPSRTFYTMENPAHWPVINSISDLPDYGNEQDFFICWDLTDPNANGGERGNLLTAEDQHTYRCQLLYDNGAAPGFDHLPSPSQAVNPMAMLQNTRALVQFPERSTKNAELQGIVTATNTYPTEVYDSVIFTSTKPVTLTYVTGSARLLIGGGITPNGGAPLTDDAALIGDGALVGDHQDGFVDQNPGYIQFEVTVTLG